MFCELNIVNEDAYSLIYAKFRKQYYISETNMKISYLFTFFLHDVL